MLLSLLYNYAILCCLLCCCSICPARPRAAWVVWCGCLDSKILCVV
nr:MAG TPA: hypothetical protein [Caudoviricetes sp.]